MGMITNHSVLDTIGAGKKMDESLRQLTRGPDNYQEAG